MAWESSFILTEIPFETALSRGLGRAIPHLNAENAPLYRTSLLEACLHDERWDRQIEDSRAAYLLEALRATGEPQWYAAHLRTALLSDESNCDLYQVFALAIKLTEAGIADLRPVVYFAFKRQAERDDDLDAEELIRLDGRAGYAFAIRCFASRSLPEDELYIHYLLLDELILRDGEAETRLFTAELTVTEPSLRAYLEHIWRAWEEWKKELKRKKTRRDEPAYEAIKAMIESPEKAMRDWGRCADEATFLRLAEDMVRENDPHRLNKYLRLFHNRAFPLDPAFLIELARRDDTGDILPQRAVNALKQITHPAVRAFAVESIGTLGMEWRGVRLLTNNPASDDIPIMEALLERHASLPENEYHSIGFSVRDYFEMHPNPNAAASLTLLYEYGPCSFCRNHSVDMLLDMGLLPQWMREECRYDSEERTRKLIRGSE